MRKLAIAISCAALLATASCEKSKPSTDIKASGALKDSERALLGKLPAGAQLVFGGNYADFMTYWENSPIKELVDDMMAKLDTGGTSMQDFMNCFVEESKDVKLAGSVEFGGSNLQMRMVFSGMGAKMLTTCAQKGGLNAKADDDGKFVLITGVSDGMGGTSDIGYYLPEENVVYTSQKISMGLMGMGGSESGSRADLEAELKAAASNAAVDDPKIKKMLERADRSKDFWFSGSAEGTPAADKIGAGHGWIDASKDALSLGFSIELSDGMAKEAVTQFGKVKDQLGQLEALPQGKKLKSLAEKFLKDANLTNDGETLKGRFTLRNDVLKEAIPIVKQFGGGMF